MPASNTRDCFSEFVGQRVIGVLFDACPPSRKDIASGTKTLVFEDGRGLTISSKGTFWVESEEEIRRATKHVADHLKATKRDLKDVLKLAGAHA